MSYLLVRKNKRRKIWIWAGAIILLGVFLLFRGGIFKGLSFVAGEVFRPVLIVGNGTGNRIKSLGSYFASKTSLKKENDLLREELKVLEARELSRSLLSDENTILKEILGRKKEEVKMILAAILSKPNQSAYDTLLLDLGTEDGIKPGDRVFARGYIPIGRIGEATPNSSKVILFSSSGEKTTVALAGASEGIAEEKSIFYDLVGRGGGNFEMVLPREIVFGAGDQALLPGISEYPVARALSIISDPRDPFKKVLLESPVNVLELRFVQVEAR